MQIGQVPVMFTPEAVVNDTRAITTGPQDLTTMFPQEIDMEDEGVLFDTRIWFLVGAAALVFWAMRKPGR